MADLLECLLQMKGLGESAPRLLRLTSEAPARGAAAVAVAADTATRLATAERRWLSALAAALPHMTEAAAPQAPAPDGTAEATAAFERLRRSALGILDRCTAADLSARAELPGHGPVTVADIVAHMLAHDTERLAELRAALSGPADPSVP